MASQSADRLAALALAGPTSAEVGRLARHLATDPPLALWTICAAHSSEELAPQNLLGLAEWLIVHAIEALAADAAPRAELKVREWSQLADAGLMAVEVYESLAGDIDHDASEGSLLALLHNSPAWLQSAATESTAIPPALLPTWLADWRDSASARQVARAIELAKASNETAPPEIDLAACRHQAEQRRDAWLAPGSWPDEQLSALATRLVRLKELEHHFADCLQREKLHSMAELAAGAGHEINNPLAVIAGRAQLFLHEENDPERRRGLALINAQAMRVYEMIADLRLFARPPEPEREEFDLVRHVERVLEELGPRATEQETVLRRTGHPGPLTVTADPAQWAVALKALVTNALEALGGGGHVELELGRRQTETYVRVIDDGPGIATNDLPHIFDPFFSARQAGRGLGMGLSKCWRIVTNHGGRIDVESQPGQGAAFTLHLPD